MTRVLLLLPENGVRRWHRTLTERLNRDGCDAAVALRPGPARPPAVAVLEALENLLFPLKDDPMEAERAGAWMRPPSGVPDLVFDLTGRADPGRDALFPIFGGATGDDARDLMLLAREEARIGLARWAGAQFDVQADALIAVERPDHLGGGRAAVASRLSTLIRARARRGPVDGGGRAAPQVRGIGLRAPTAFLVASLVHRVRRRLTRLVAHDAHWRIAWRRVSAENAVYSALEWPECDWTVLNDDRRRYFADPFLFAHEGVVHVFCEEYPYATGKGVISWFPLDAGGRPAAPPRVVLERPCHLSYPLVFRHDGAIWMAPEASAGGAFELFRADGFPQRWSFDRVAIDLPLADATMFERDGRCWLTATNAEDGGSSWDCLSLFEAPAPLGPWTPCGDGPALIDASSARPAGHVFERGGALWRPAQDCTGGYGAGLALCRIDRLDSQGLRQHVVRRLRPPPGLDADCVHTLNAGGGFEIVDVAGTMAKSAWLD
jgi:hypothetical protein